MGLPRLCFRADNTEVPIGLETIGAFARLGVTTARLATDDHATAVIAKGWAIDPPPRLRDPGARQPCKRDTNPAADRIDGGFGRR